MFLDVVPMRITEKIQCRSRAAIGLSSDRDSFDFVFEVAGNQRFMSRAKGVIVFPAKNCEKGSIPSLAISCLTNRDEERRSQDSATNGMTQAGERPTFG